MASQDGIDNMKRYRIKAQQIISAALWLAEVVALALLLKHVSEPGNTSYHTYTLYKDTVLAFIISLPMLVMNIRKIVWGSTDILILSLAGIYFACSIINRSIAASVALQEAFPYAVLYFCIRVFICSGKGISAAYLVVILSLWSCAGIWIQAIRTFRIRNNRKFPESRTLWRFHFHNDVHLHSIQYTVWKVLEICIFNTAQGNE